jgi:hypothetical protein
VKLTAWARQQGISDKTAYRRFHAGTLGVPAIQKPNGRIEVDAGAEDCRGACLSHLHKACLVDAVIDGLRDRRYELDLTQLGAAP